MKLFGLLLLPSIHADQQLDPVSLLQHTAQLSLPSNSAFAANDTIYHLHIPKAAGISFGLDSLRVVGENGLHVASREGCYAWRRGNPRIRGTAVMLRDPHKHVLSQFDFCNQGMLADYVGAVHVEGTPPFPKRFEDWVQAWAELQGQSWHGDFTPSAELVSDSLTEPYIRWLRMQAWQSPPFSPEYHRLYPYQWPRLDGGGTCWHFVHVPFQCYVPISLQTQRLVCDTPLNYTEMPDAELAVRNMQDLWFVGIVEAYEPSMCLLHAKLGHALPQWCHCKQSVEAEVHQENQQSTHSVALEELPGPVLAMLDEITAADRQLYKAARVRFLREIDKVEKEHGFRIVCEKLREQLEA